jgi:uncharacterized paraquat-inducible protein A
VCRLLACQVTCCQCNSMVDTVDIHMVVSSLWFRMQCKLDDVSEMPRTRCHAAALLLLLLLLCLSPP